MDLNELAGNVAQFNGVNDLNIDLKNRLPDLYSELGELAKEILKESVYGKKDCCYPIILMMKLATVFIV